MLPVQGAREESMWSNCWANCRRCRTSCAVSTRWRRSTSSEPATRGSCGVYSRKPRRTLPKRPKNRSWHSTFRCRTSTIRQCALRSSRNGTVLSIPTVSVLWPFDDNAHYDQAGTAQCSVFRQLVFCDHLLRSTVVITLRSKKTSQFYVTAVSTKVNLFIFAYGTLS